MVGTDPSADVALLQIEGVSGLPTVTFGDSSTLQVGDSVVAIGNALGLAAGTPTVSAQARKPKSSKKIAKAPAQKPTPQ